MTAPARCPDCRGSGVCRSPIGERIPCPRCDSFGTLLPDPPAYPATAKPPCATPKGCTEKWLSGEPNTQERLARDYCRFCPPAQRSRCIGIFLDAPLPASRYTEGVWGGTTSARRDEPDFSRARCTHPGCNNYPDPLPRRRSPLCPEHADTPTK